MPTPRWVTQPLDALQAAYVNVSCPYTAGLIERRSSCLPLPAVRLGMAPRVAACGARTRRGTAGTSSLVRILPLSPMPPSFCAGRCNPSASQREFGLRRAPAATGSSRNWPRRRGRRSFYYPIRSTASRLLPVWATGPGSPAGHRAADLRSTQLRSPGTGNRRAQQRVVGGGGAASAALLAQRPGASDHTGGP